MCVRGNGDDLFVVAANRADGFSLFFYQIFVFFSMQLSTAMSRVLSTTMLHLHDSRDRRCNAFDTVFASAGSGFLTYMCRSHRSHPATEVQINENAVYLVYRKLIRLADRLWSATGGELSRVCVWFVRDVKNMDGEQTFHSLETVEFDMKTFIQNRKETHL